MKKFLTTILVIMLLFSGCSGKTQDADVGNETSGFPQLDMPEIGEKIAVINTNYGTIKVRLFPDVAPLAVENFVTLAESGYYDGVIFHRVINNFMMQGGDPTGTGKGGESMWGEKFEDEFDLYYRNFRGALSMANGGENTNGSQFFIVQNSAYPPGYIDELSKQVEEYADNPIYYNAETGTYDYVKDVYSQEAMAKHEEIGGAISLDYAHTVFGHVFEGMDIVDAICAVETDKDDKPVEDVIIESIQIAEYEG